MKVILFLFIVFSFTFVSAQEMKVHVPELKLYNYDGNYILYEKLISSDKASQFFQQLENDRVLSPDFYRIPNTENYYFVSAQVKGVGELSYPVKGFLFEESQNVLIERFRSIDFKFGGSEFKPIFFVGENSVLILAEKNYLGFHGIEAFEFKQNQLKYLGSLNIAYKVFNSKNEKKKKDFYHNENPLKLHYKANPAEKVKIISLKNSYRMELKGEFYENFEYLPETKISSENSTVIYNLDENGFQLLEIKSNKKRTEK